MPIYAFEGRREQTGEKTTGLREAASHAMLGQDLLTEGVLLTRFEERTQRLPGATLLSTVFQRVPTLERMLFARYFALMLRAGLDVKRALSALQQQTRNKPMRSAIEAIYQGVERGQTVADSMQAYPNAFSSLFVGFVRVGETTGKLQETLEILAEQLRKEYELKRAVRGGMLYPIVILAALVAVGTTMMIFVVPKLVDVFEGFNVELPLMTRMLIAISGFFEHYWYIVIILLIAGLVGGWLLLKFRSVYAGLMHAFLYTPIIGPIMQEVNLARFARNLSSLLESGVPFVQALDIMGENTPHPSYAQVFTAAREHVKSGKAMSEFLADFKRLFPPLVVNIAKVGEETGELSEVLKEVALFYEGEVDQTMKNLASIMEPVLMIVIGIAVGALAISIISPIYSLVSVI